MTNGSGMYASCPSAPPDCTCHYHVEVKLTISEPHTDLVRALPKLCLYAWQHDLDQQPAQPSSHCNLYGRTLATAPCHAAHMPGHRQSKTLC